MMEVIRVAYTLEQCWHRVPGGTGVAALRTAQTLSQFGDVDLIGVAGKHAQPPAQEWRPTIPVRQLPLAAPWLYQAWLRLGWPRPESVVPDAAVVHATTLIPCPTRKPLVVTLHDLAFLHNPSQFSRVGNAVFRRSLHKIKRHADLVLCCSQATLDDSLAVGIGGDRLRLVPLGVDAEVVTPTDVARVRSLYQLPERYLLFVGTLEPRKNLRGLAAAVQLLDEPLPLVVVGASGWGDASDGMVGDVRFVGFVPTSDLAPLYALAQVFCYPSEREGYGLPVLEAMAQGTPVVTSAGSATEETAAGAAVLVDPSSPLDIARGITEALLRRDELSLRGIKRATRSTWRMTAELTRAAYRELA